MLFFFFIYKTLKQINKTLIKCSRKRRERVWPGREHFFGHYEWINFGTKHRQCIVNLCQSLTNNVYLQKHSPHPGFNWKQYYDPQYTGINWVSSHEQNDSIRAEDFSMECFMWQYVK